MEEVRPLNVLIDINVVLDIFLVREPWFSDAKAVWAAHTRRVIVGHIAAHGFTNLFYIARRTVGAEKAREAVHLCLQTFEVIPVGRRELEYAESHEGSDIEDNLVLACAVEAKLDTIVTRDPKGFAGSPVQVLTPAGLLALLPQAAGS